jgi:hypothetical protein
MAIIACALFCIMVDIAKDGKAKGVSERELSDKLLMQYLDIRFSDEKRGTKRKAKNRHIRVFGHRIANEK